MNKDETIAELVDVLREIVEYSDCGDDLANMDAAIERGREAIANAEGKN